MTLSLSLFFFIDKHTDSAKSAEIEHALSEVFAMVRDFYGYNDWEMGRGLKGYIDRKRK